MEPTARLEESIGSEVECVQCILCGENNTRIFFREQGPAAVVKCRNDGLLYLNPRPRVQRVRTVHKRYVREDNLEIFRGFRREVLQREANVIKMLKSGGRLLDVGCATGTFFENFRNREWDLYGVETSPLGVGLSSTQYQANVVCGTIQEACYPSNFFDVVTVLDALYYSPDPKSDLAEIRRVLKDDGILAIEIPGLSYRLLRARGPLCWILDRQWRRMSTESWHLYYFSPSHMNLLLQQSGFNVTHMIPEQASVGRAGLLYTLNRIHFWMARLLFKASFGRISVAGRELYLAVKS